MPLSRSEIDSAFQTNGRKPFYLNLSYAASLSLTALFSAILFLVYPCLIVGLGYLGLYLIVNGFTAILTNDWNLYVQIGAFVLLGAVVISIPGLMWAMVRPFFFRASQSPAEIEIDSDSDPALVYFVHSVAKSVGSKLPTKIILTGGIDASACTGGFFQTILGTTRELRLGMCLFPSLSVTAIGAIIAHECGHFSQTFAMRYTALIRGVGSWFYRASHYFTYRHIQLRIRIHEDDEDENRLRLWVAVGMNLIVRYVLWTFFKLSAVVSSFASRRMEFHADTYEAEFAGTEGFREAMTGMETLGFAFHKAIAECQFLYKSKRLPDDFATFVAIRMRELDEHEKRRIRQQRANAEVHWYSSHPETRERIRAAEKRNKPGFFKLDALGSGLFSDFTARAQFLSFHFYDIECDIQVYEDHLIPVSEFDKESKAAVETIEGCRDYETSCSTVLSPFIISCSDFAWDPLPSHSLAARFRREKEGIDAHISELETERARLRNLLTLRFKIRIARGASVKRIPFDFHSFGLPDNSIEAIGKADDEITTDIEACYREIEKSHTKKAALLFTTLNLMSRPELCPGDPAGRKIAYTELGALLVASEHIAFNRDRTRYLHDSYEALAVSLRLSGIDASDSSTTNLINHAKQDREDLVGRFADISIPSDGNNDAQLIGDLLGAAAESQNSGRGKLEAELFACGNVLAEIGEIQRRIEKRFEFLLRAVDQLSFQLATAEPNLAVPQNS